MLVLLLIFAKGLALILELNFTVKIPSVLFIKTSVKKVKSQSVDEDFCSTCSQ